MRNKAVNMLDNLRNIGFSDSDILDYIIYNHLSGDDAVEVLEGYYEEVDIELDED